MQSKTQYSMQLGHTRIIIQRDLCATVLNAHEDGILPMTDSEVDVVKAMEKSNKPLKDTHLAVLRAFIERAGK
jgi:hypothetical protein